MKNEVATEKLLESLDYYNNGKLTLQGLWYRFLVKKGINQGPWVDDKGTTHICITPIRAVEYIELDFKII
jgi:hypothetical protein